MSMHFIANQTKKKPTDKELEMYDKVYLRKLLADDKVTGSLESLSSLARQASVRPQKTCCYDPLT